MKIEAPPALPSPFQRNWIWSICQGILQALFCFWLRYQARGFEKLSNESGALLVINHQSYLDPLLAGLPLRRPVSYLARDSLFRVPVLGWILRNTYVMPINRDAASTASLREALRRLELGFLVGIFPEGSRTLDGQVGEFKPGFMAIARRSRKPLIPVGIAGAYSALGRGKMFLRPATVRVVFGEPISPEELARYSDRSQEAELMELVRQRIIACVAEAEAWRSGRDSALPGSKNEVTENCESPV